MGVGDGVRKKVLLTLLFNNFSGEECREYEGRCQKNGPTFMVSKPQKSPIQNAKAHPHSISSSFPRLLLPVTTEQKVKP